VKSPRLPAIVWALCAAAGVLMALEPGLPERVATHFSWSGRPNGWMPASGFRAAGALFVVGFSGFFIALLYCIRFFPPETLNVPNPGYWRSPEHHREACDIVFAHSFWLAAIAALWAGLLHLLVYRANRSSPPHLEGGGILLLSVGFFAAMLAATVPLLLRFRRVPPEAAPRT
jgi:serine/threonine-protein kinase